MVLVGDCNRCTGRLAISIPAMIPCFSRLVLAFGLAVILTQASASDWPQFLGPTRNGVYTGPALTASWPKDGPPILWQRKVGAGFSGPAVADGKLILFH